MILKVLKNYMKGINMDKENTNWQQSVTGVSIRNNKILLAIHTYGAGKNL